METPDVGPGDLLLMCLNTIHATQTTEHRRLAVSLRTGDPETPVDWHRVAGSSTARMMKLFADEKPVVFPGFSTHPGKQLRRHCGGHRADPDWRARVAENPGTVNWTMLRRLHR